MKIVQMIDTLQVGGAQKMQVFLARSLRSLGITLTLINLSRHADASLVAQLEAEDVRIVSFPFRHLFSPVVFFRLVIFLRKEKFDLIHAYLTYSNIIGSIAGCISGIPVIASLRSADYRQRKNAIRERLEDFCLQHFADRVLANGDAVGEFARQRSGKTPVDVIVNAVNMVLPLAEEERNFLRGELVGNPRRPLVMSVGRLTKPKGFFDLLDAFKIIHSAQPYAALVIAGGGPLFEELTSRVNELGLGQDVFLLGQRNDVPRLLAAADIYVNSSHREGTPVSVLEAMSAGLAVVATSVGENPFLLDQSTGRLVPPNRPDQLADAVLTLLESPQTRMDLGQSARALAQKKYGQSEWRRNLLALYAKFLPKAEEVLARLDA